MHEQSRSGGKSEARPPVFKIPTSKKQAWYSFIDPLQYGWKAELTLPSPGIEPGPVVWKRDTLPLGLSALCICRRETVKLGLSSNP
ncbi:hypothetical protein TNCV_624031 [Trichonephila clavipes]|nr:hypothetical protein TNCV_624031 [Trichonephila clavipes]